MVFISNLDIRVSIQEQFDDFYMTLLGCEVQRCPLVFLYSLYTRVLIQKQLHNIRMPTE